MKGVRVYTAGIVILLGPDVGLADESRRRLAHAGPFILGEGSLDCLPAVLEAENPREARHWHEWAAALPGVSQVEVVFVHWDESEGCDEHA